MGINQESINLSLIFQLHRNKFLKVHFVDFCWGQTRSSIQSSNGEKWVLAMFRVYIIGRKGPETDYRKQGAYKN
jgi:hypothetical protein